MFLLLLALAMHLQVRAYEPYTFAQAQAFLKTHCEACHNTKVATGGFNIFKYPTREAMLEDSRHMQSVLRRVREGQMPPVGRPAPAAGDRDAFTGWLETSLRTAACAEGLAPVRALLKRLNRNEYSATIRDLLNIHVNAGRDLPTDGAGGEGFDNAAETLFLSPLHAEKYLDAARGALTYAFSDTRARARFLIAEAGQPESSMEALKQLETGRRPDRKAEAEPEPPAGPPLTAEQAGRKVLEAFVPRAFRRPARAGEVDKYYALFQHALRRKEPYDDAVRFALEGVLISPSFLFRIEEANPDAGPAPVSGYEMASRLSYFLWGSMPDEALMQLAAEGRLNEPAVLKEQVSRMLKDAKSTEFAEHFVEQWLGTRELGRDIKPDPKAFAPYYESEVQSGIRYEPILFFQEVLANNLSLLNFIDSKFTVVSNKLAKYYGFGTIQGLRQQPKRVELPEGSHRGGLIGMSAVLAVSSLPQRTSPVLRGKWVLDAMLGTPSPPPPPSVPALAEQHSGAAPRTMRERLSRHRTNPACASCHNRLDPIGFALENFDVIGRWRTEEGGKPVDAKGELPDGTRFEGPEQLKAVLMQKKDLFLRNLTSKLLGYALGRGLTLQDSCTVEQIVKQLEKDEYRAQTLVNEIVLSVPFRYKPGTAANMVVKEAQ
ncbi:MAG: DUF1592 domain-containing protein [Bryobacterales bacterium]|nr:DUF1592 domain-containing protein [Bryobacterales bacterium]